MTEGLADPQSFAGLRAAGQNRWRAWRTVGYTEGD